MTQFNLMTLCYPINSINDKKILIEFKLNVLVVMARRPVLCYDACVQRSILAQSVTFYQYVTSQPETGFVSTHGFLEYEIFLSRVQ